MNHAGGLGSDKGLGSLLWASMYSWIAAMRSGTEWKTPRRNALSVSSRNQRSTRLSHDDEVGVKWRWNRGCLSSHADVVVLVGGVVVQDQVDLQVLGHLAVDGLEEFQTIPDAGAEAVHCPMIMPVSTSSAANRVVVPWRL